MDADALVKRLADIPGVVAVALGGSRATGTERPDSDWDFALYYRGRINSDDVRTLGYPGVVVEPGDWGRLVNGGAWLEIDGVRVDLLYRDLDFVEHWLHETEQGRFEVDRVAGHIAGLPTYVLAGELAVGKVLHGELPRLSFPRKLRETAPSWWLGDAAFSLYGAGLYARLRQVTACVGVLARAAVCAAHARLAARGEWALNEKGIVDRAGLAEADGVLAAAGATPDDLARAVAEMRSVLGLSPPRGHKADDVVAGQEPSTSG